MKENIDKEQKTSRKPIWIFSAASFLNDLGSDMIAPIWPLFVTGVLKAPVTVLGILDGFAETTVSFSQVLSGYLSDRTRKRKIFIWLGYFGGFIGRLGYAASTSFWHLFPLRFIDRLGKMRDAPRDAIVADISDRKTRGTNFGIIEAFDNLGAIFGVILSVVLFQFIGFRPLMFLAAIPSLISVFLVFTFIADRPNSQIFVPLKLKALGKNFRLFLISNVLFGLGFFSYSFLLIFLQEAQFTLTSIPIFYLIFTVFASGFSWPVGRLADIFSRKFVTGLAFLLWGVTTAGFIVFSSSLGFTMAAILFAIYGIHKAALRPVQSTFISELAPPESKASTLGVFKMAMGLSALPASFIAGLLWDTIGPVAPFVFSLFMTGLALLILLFVKEQKMTSG